MLNDFHAKLTESGLKPLDKDHYKRVLSQFKKGTQLRVTVEEAGSLGDMVRRHYFQFLNGAYKESGQPVYLMHKDTKETYNNGESIFGLDSKLTDGEKDRISNCVREILSEELNMIIPRREKV